MITYRFVSQIFLGEPIKVQYSKYSSPIRIDLGSGTFPFEYTTDQRGGTYFFYIPKLDTTFTKTIDIPPIDFVVNSMNVPDCDISGIINEIPECDISSGIIEIPVCDVDYVITIVTPTPTPTPSVVCPVITGVTVGPIEISGGQPYTLVDNASSLYLQQFNTLGQYYGDIPPQSNSILPNSLFQNEITVIVPSPYWFGGPCQYCFNIISGELVECNFVIPSPTPTQTINITLTPTPTITPTPSVTETIITTATPTNTETLTLTPTPTITPTPSSTESITPTVTPTNTNTPTVTQTSTNTPTNSITPTRTATLTTYYGVWSDYTTGGQNCAPTLSGLTLSPVVVTSISTGSILYNITGSLLSISTVSYTTVDDTFTVLTNSVGVVSGITNCDGSITPPICPSNQYSITNSTSSAITVNNVVSPYTNVSLPQFNLQPYTILIVDSCDLPIAPGGSVISLTSPTPTPTITSTVTPTQPEKAFISIWSGSSVTLPYNAIGTYTGTIDWGDGSVSANTFANRTHAYSGNGPWTITITGTITGWATGSAPTESNKLLEIKQWNNVRNVFGQAASFSGCSNLVLTGVTDTYNFSGITNTQTMFTNCNSITTINNISSWSVSGVTNMGNMFNGCINFNDNITTWDVSNVTSLSNMLYSASSFNQNLGSWDISKAVYNDFIAYCGISTANYDNTLIGWSSLTLQTNRYFGAYGLTYTSAGAGGAARSSIISNYSWSFVGDTGI
jgi:surface protein